MRRAVSEADDKSNKVKRKQIERKINIKLNKKQIITLAICFVIIGCIIAVNNYTAIGLVLNKNINSEDAVQIELQTSDNKIVPCGNEILVYNKGKITSYNNYGKNTGEIILEDTVEAEIYTAGKYIQVINKDKGIVYVYKNKYEVARIKIDGKIYSGNINSDGMSVIEYSSNGNKTQLGIYDNSGEMKYNIKLSNNIIGKYVLSDDSKHLVYIDVNVNGISAHTNVNWIDLYNLKDDEPTAKNIYSIENCLAYDVYWDGKNVVVRFDDNYFLYNVSSNKKEIVPISDKQVVNIGDYNKRYAYILIDENGNYRLNIRKMTSDSIKEVTVGEAPKYLKYENGIVYVCYAKRIEAYNNFGNNIKNYDSSMVITEPIIFNDGRSLVMAISNKLIMFTI